jgi:hypothetical protein
VTSQPQPAPGEVKSAGQYLRPLRDLAAYALVGAAAIFIFLALLDLIPDGQGQFSYRTQGSFGSFINLETIGFPLAAVLLALLVQPRHPKAQLIVLIAVIEYGLMALFGIFFGVLIGLINVADQNGARAALEGLLSRVAWLAVFAVAAYAVFLIWRNMFYTARPKPQPQPGMYGQPAYNQPGAFPGQPGYGPPPGQPYPGQPQPGQPHPGQPYPGQPHPGQPHPGQPGQPGFPPPPPAGGYPPVPGQQGFGPGVYGQPAPAWNQPAVPMPPAATQPVPPGPFAPTSAAPASGAPAPQSGAPASAAPASGAPASAGGATYPASVSPAAGATYPAEGATYPAEGTTYPAAEPTQVVPQAQSQAETAETSETDDRTQTLGESRPGFRPADQDPHRQ